MATLELLAPPVLLQQQPLQQQPLQQRRQQQQRQLLQRLLLPLQVLGMLIILNKIVIFFSKTEKRQKIKKMQKR